MDDDRMQDRLERLGRMPGMNPERAAELLRLLPELGRGRTSIVLMFAGLKEGVSMNHRPLAKPNHISILRLLAAALPEAAKSQDTKLGILLRHLMENRKDNTGVAFTTYCLTALLRHYSDHLLHPAAPAWQSDDAEDDMDDGDLLAAEEES